MVSKRRPDKDGNKTKLFPNFVSEVRLVEYLPDWAIAYGLWQRRPIAGKQNYQWTKRRKHLLTRQIAGTYWSLSLWIWNQLIARRIPLCKCSSILLVFLTWINAESLLEEARKRIQVCGIIFLISEQSLLSTAFKKKLHTKLDFCSVFFSFNFWLCSLSGTAHVEGRVGGHEQGAGGGRGVQSSAIYIF